MLPSDAPFLETALALLAWPFRPVTAGGLSLPANAGSSSANAPCQAHMNHPAASSGVSTKDKIDFIVASEGVLGPSFAINNPRRKRRSIKSEQH